MPERIFKGCPAKDKKIVVIGDVMLDHYVSGSCTRISPEAPVPVIKVDKERFVLGGAANVAANVRATGAETICIGMCGEMDEDQKTLELIMKELGIETRIIQDCHMRTTRKTRIVAQGQQIVRCDYETGCWNASRASKKQLMATLKSSIELADAIIVSDYNKGVCSDDIIKSIANQKVPWVVDPKTPWTTKYPGATLVKPNLKEASSSRIRINSPQEAGMAAKIMRKRIKAQAVAVTIGNLGACLATNKAVLHCPVAPVEVFDPTGAGDVFAAFSALAISIGLSTTDAVRFANAAASVSVSRHGATIVTWNEAVKAMRQQPDPVLLFEYA